MTVNAHNRNRRHSKLTRAIGRITLDGKDLRLCDVYYVDTRRGIVRGYQTQPDPAKPNGRKFLVDLGSKGFEIAKWEKRGSVRFWLKGASKAGASKAALA